MTHGLPDNCSIDPTTGNVAVANTATPKGNITIFTPSGPEVYSNGHTRSLTSCKEDMTITEICTLKRRHTVLLPRSFAHFPTARPLDLDPGERLVSLQL
jgi:hypothetical protein